MNARQKGQIFCAEVKRILEAIGHVVDGPFYKSCWFNNRSNPVHCDIFGIFDIVSCYQGIYYFHQVSTLDHKANKVKAILDVKMSGWVWARVSNGRVFYRIFIVKPGQEVEEAEIRWKV